MAPRMLAKALHTITAVARVAVALDRLDALTGQTPLDHTIQALYVLGYTEDQIDQRGPLFLACVAAVSKACGVQS